MRSLRPPPLIDALALALIFLSACTPARLRRVESPDLSSKARAEKPMTVAPLAQLNFPRAQSSDSLLSLWIGDLQRPRLSSQTGAAVACSMDDSAAEIMLANPEELSCPELVAANVRTNLSCFDSKTLLLRLGKTKCSKIPLLRSLLAQILLPSGWGLYSPAESLEEGGVQLRPNLARYPQVAAGLIDIRLSDKNSAGNPFLESGMEAWLANSGPSGTFALDLNLSSNAADDEGAVAAFLSLIEALKKAPRPKKFAQLIFEHHLENALHSMARLPSRPKRRDAKGEVIEPSYFFTMQSSPKDPLLRNSCAYVDQWIKAEQLLLGRWPGSSALNATKVDFSCSFVWADEASPDSGVRLTRLPLPLMLASSQLFPIKTLDEARSVAVMQSLKVMK